MSSSFTAKLAQEKQADFQLFRLAKLFPHVNEWERVSASADASLIFMSVPPQSGNEWIDLLFSDHISLRPNQKKKALEHRIPRYLRVRKDIRDPCTIRFLLHIFSALAKAVHHFKLHQMGRELCVVGPNVSVLCFAISRRITSERAWQEAWDYTCSSLSGLPLNLCTWQRKYRVSITVAKHVNPPLFGEELTRGSLKQER